jgi:hypothetical protein
LQTFERDKTSQAIVVLGTQGVGKTNLLNWYQDELQDLYRDEEGYYIIRYYPDPEQSFDPILRKIFEDLYENRLFEKLAEQLTTLQTTQREKVLATVQYSDFRELLRSLTRQAIGEEFSLPEKEALALEWLIGLRVLNRHKDALGVRLRLDTLEAKTRVLHDLVEVGNRLDILRGIFLLLDELEKLDHSLSKLPVTRFLLAVRALMDALPQHLFLVLAMTPAAMTRYFSLLPALHGRLQTRIQLQPLEDLEQAKDLYAFYLNAAKERARATGQEKGWQQGSEPILTSSELRSLFDQLARVSGQLATRGITQRTFLDKLHDTAEEKFRSLTGSTQATE